MKKHKSVLDWNFRDRVCKRCSKQFKPRNGRQINCLNCWELAKKDYIAQWCKNPHKKQKNAEYRKTLKRKEYMRNYMLTYPLTDWRVRIYADTDITQSFLMKLYSTKYCSICEIELTSMSYQPNSRHLDHITPLIMGGKHSKNNVRATCRTCNLSRPKNGSDIEFIGGKSDEGEVT